MVKIAKVLVLLSGGLDSLLAVKILQDQVKVEALYVKLPFSKDNEGNLQIFCKRNRVKLHVLNATRDKLFREYIRMLRTPKFQRGTAFNPCIDCHIFILKKAELLSRELGIDIIATGEVLGERPMSQHMGALKLVEKESGLTGRLLRPLSAKLLPETEAEKRGLIDREMLFDIQGRRREKQLGLAREYDIDFPSPGGGCLLCEKEYCKKLEPILEKKISYKDIQLLSIGRHFRSSDIILGKNAEENDLLEKEPGIKVIPKEPGPTALINNKRYVNEAKKLIQKYSKHKIKKFLVKI